MICLFILQVEIDMKTLPSFLLTLFLAFMAVAILPACSSNGETTTSGTSEDTSDPTNCDQALTSEERQKCLEQLSN